MSRSLVRRVIATACSAALALGVAVALPTTASAATFDAFGGAAYGTYVRVGDVASSGKSSYVSMCTSKIGHQSTNNTGELDLDDVIEAGVATTKVTSKQSGTTSSSTTTTTVAGFDALDGLITADAVTTVATASRGTGGYSTQGSTTFVNLKIAGIPQLNAPASNAIDITLPGIARVRINRQATSTAYGITAITQQAVRIDTLQGNTLNLPVGYIVIANSSATIKNVSQYAYGSAYGSQVDLAGVIKSGATAAVKIPCGGTNGEKIYSSLASLTLPDTAVDLGEARTSAYSSPDHNTAITKAIVEDVNLLDGIVTIDAVTAKATAVRSGSTVKTSSYGSSIAGLKINGNGVTISTKENRTINIAGVGTLYLRKAERTSVSIRVTAVQLVLSTEKLGLKKGTVINVASAKAGVQ